MFLCLAEAGVSLSEALRSSAPEETGSFGVGPGSQMGEP